MKKLLILIVLVPFITKAQTIINAAGQQQSASTTNTVITQKLSNKGGYYGSVADITERNAIPAFKRDTGMSVLVRTDNTVYALGVGKTNSDWFNVGYSQFKIDSLLALKVDYTYADRFVQGANSTRTLSFANPMPATIPSTFFSADSLTWLSKNPYPTGVGAYVDGINVRHINTINNYGYYLTSGQVSRELYFTPYASSTTASNILGSYRIWHSGNSTPITTFTTTGTSGAATWNPTTGALNIPQYSSSGFVPYTGATADLDLVSTNKGIYAEFIEAGHGSGLGAGLNAGVFYNSSTTGMGVLIQAGDATHKALEIEDYTSGVGGTRAVIYGDGHAIFNSSVTAASLIKSGGTSAQILAADGTVITAGTNITISGGTISSSGGSSFTFVDNEIPSGAINSSNVSFTWAHAPGTTLTLLYNGVALRPTIDYTTSSTTTTLTFTPITGDSLYGIYRY